jgi:hypothetical protein
MALQGGGKLDEVGKKNLCVLRRFCHGKRVWQVEAELLYVFQ